MKYSYDFEINPLTIKILRTIKGITIKELAEVCYLSKTLLTKIEGDQRRITKLTNFRLMQGFQKLGYTQQQIIVADTLVNIETKGGGKHDKGI